mmetsp:Transcript_18964/g.48515  ORF Transcript_18964/g.48515 Transcript_18964/m.48515 type:complete len:263 (-) Transcript_18964:280-1068(-)
MAPGSYALLSRCFYPVARWSLEMVCSNLFVSGGMALAGMAPLSNLRHKRLAGYVGIYPYYVLQVYYAHVGTLEIFNGGLDRMHDSSPGCDVFSHLYIASNLVAALGQLQTEQGVLLGQLMCHHVLSIAAVGAAFYFDRFRFWSAFAGLCEVTNLFLVPIFAAKEMPVIKTHRWYKLNSILLYATFIVYRGGLFPAWLYLWYRDPKPTDMHWMEHGYGVTVLAIAILSVFWFAAIHRGVVHLFTPGYYDSNGLHKGQMPTKAE